MTRVLYIQYTNPGGYPPLEHSAAILSSRGCEVRVLGTTAMGTNRLAWAPRAGVAVSIMPVRATGLGQKFDYFRYAMWVIGTALRLRPHWLYVSDALAAPVSLVLHRVTRVRLVYHEHDEPIVEAPSLFMRAILRARTLLARTADEVVVPNAARGDRLRLSTGREAPVRTIWNCPIATDVGSNPPAAGGRLRIMYQGSINRSRLPLTVIHALALLENAELVIVGYETLGSRNYVAELMEEAASRGCGNRVQYLGAIPQRDDMLKVTSSCHVGLALMPMQSQDFNEEHMEGASNKAFDYMARGLGLVVSDLPGWRAMFAMPGYACTCDPREAESIASALGWYAANRDEATNRGQAAQYRIRTDWNYEAQFEPLARAMLEEREHRAQERTARS